MVSFRIFNRDFLVFLYLKYFKKSLFLIDKQLIDKVNEMREKMEIIEATAEYLVDNMTGLTGSAYGVVKPTDLAELVDALTFAKAQQIGVIVIGANTGLSGATLPEHDELLIDLSGWNKILDLDEATGSLTVEAGVTLNQIYDYVEARGYFYPPDPGAKQATIGGNISTNAGGMRAVKYGVTRDFVKALQVVLIDGTVLELGSINQKDSTNYDLKDLIIGSEGTLAIITRATLKVIAQPQVSQSILISFDNLDLAIENVAAILKTGVRPASVEFFEREGLKYAEIYSNQQLFIEDGEAFILLTLDGNLEQVGQEKVLVKNILKNSRTQVDLSEQQAKIAWQLRDNLAAGVQAQTIAEPVDIVVPTSKITETVKYLKAIAEAEKLEIVTFGHAGDGNIHALILKKSLSDQLWQKSLSNYLEKMYHYVNQVGGLASAEHGIGTLKRPYFIKHLDPNLYSLYQKIKFAFDPEGRLNAGKKI